MPALSLRRRPECNIRSASIQHGLMGEPNGRSEVRADVLASGVATEQWHRGHPPPTARFVDRVELSEGGIPHPIQQNERAVLPDGKWIAYAS